jgi:hypothetical protein
MTSALTNVMSWGYSLDDYAAMFALSVEDRSRSILGCGDGASSFNAEGTAQGMRVVSVDALYDLRTAQIQSQIDATPGIAAARLAAMQRFLADYPDGLNQGRYVSGTLPELPFMDNTYDLALCSHLQILADGQHDAACYLSAVQELCRVAEEVRIFLLAEVGTTSSPHLVEVETAMQAFGFSVARVPIGGEILTGANQMLRITPG